MTVTKRNPVPMAMVVGSTMVIRAWEMEGGVEQHSILRCPLGGGRPGLTDLLYIELSPGSG